MGSLPQIIFMLHHAPLFKFLVELALSAFEHMF